jgi:hypothetical protein
MVTLLSKETRARRRVPYALRRLPEASLACLLPFPKSSQLGDIILARLEQIGKSGRLELVNSRLISISPLGMREARAATQIKCVTAEE